MPNPPDPEQPKARNDIQAAWAAQASTRERFLEAVEQGVEVRDLAEEVRRIRERNGFGKLIKESMGLK